MSPDVSIVYRLATVDDVPRLADLRAAFTFEDDVDARVSADFAPAFANVVRPGIESGRWAVWVAEGDGAIVAHAYVGLIEKIPRPARERRFVGYLTNVYTEPEHRNRGVGTGLLARVVEWARTNDVELLFVWPSDDSVPLYRRLGFEGDRDPLVWYA